MQKQNSLLRNKWFSGMLALAMLGVVWNQSLTLANNPTFSLSLNSGCGSTVTQINGKVGESTMVYVCIDGANEGAGFLGAETQVSYNSNLIKVSQIACTNFETCANLSEPGKVRFLGASGPLPEGNPVSGKEQLGSFRVNFLSAGEGALAYTKTQIITQDSKVETRSAVSAKMFIEAAAPEPIEEPQEEVKEPEPQIEEEKEEIVEPPQEEEMKDEPNLAGIKGVLLSPVTKTAAPGQGVQLIGTATYHEDRPNENITSCFPCPTQGTPDVQGKTTYKVVSGPGQLSWSKVSVLPTAQNGEVIWVKASFTDYKTNTSATSGLRSIKVVAPPKEEEKDEEVMVEEVKEEPVIEPEEVKTEPLEWHPAAPETTTASLAEEALLKALQQNSSLTIPREPKDDACIANFPSGVDSDQDGLSDRTECYLNLNEADQDTDADSCFDGDELNLFYTNPLIDDCSLEQMVNERVLITDPKPEWIVRSLDISGLAPQGVKEVEITAFPALHRPLKTLMTDMERFIETLQDPNATQENEAQKTTLIEETKALLEWMNTQDHQDYALEKKVLEIARDYLETDFENLTANLNQAKAVTASLENIQTSGHFLGTVTEFSEAGLGEKTASRFHLDVDAVLKDGVYDLVAVAKEDKRILSSAPVRVTLDAQFEVANPQPERLDNVTLNVAHQSGEALLSDLQVRIQNGRPILSGRSAYGAQVFATWESLALASSIIADSDAGLFDIQSPRELDRGVEHHITLYALMEDESGKARSETVGLSFYVTKDFNDWLPWIVLIIVLMGVAALVARHRMKAIDALPPEHRAKENELYEAFGEEHHENKLPENHEEKEEEVEEAFKRE